MLIAAALVLIVPLTPMLRILLPVDQTVVLIAPALATCALAGWWAGGRLPLTLAWTGLAVLVLWQFTAGQGAMSQLTCAWAILLAFVFASVSVVGPRVAESQRPFFPRAALAIGVTFAIAAIAVLAIPDGLTTVLETLRTDVNQRGVTALAAWHETIGTTEWMDFAGQHPDAGAMAKQVEVQLQGLPGIALMLVPAMLALESLATLALVWAVYHRVGRVRLGLPLAALRDFRFNDQYVWAMVVGLALLVVPWFTKLSGAGANLLVFGGAIYALRGLGVALWFLAPGRLVMTLLIVFSFFFWHVLGVLAIGLGLGDTWLDWRSRARQQAERK